MQESLFNEVTGLQVCNFTEKRLQHRLFRLNIANFKNTYFEKHLQTLLIVVIYCIENWTKLFRNQTGLLFLLKNHSILLTPICINSFYHSLSLIAIFCYSLSLVVTCCHSLPSVVTCCTTRCHSFSLVVPLVIIRCPSLYYSLSFVVQLIVIRCHSLSFVVTRCTTRLSFYKQS